MSEFTNETIDDHLPSNLTSEIGRGQKFFPTTLSYACQPLNKREGNSDSGVCDNGQIFYLRFYMFPCLHLKIGNSQACRHEASAGSCNSKGIASDTNVFVGQKLGS